MLTDYFETMRLGNSTFEAIHERFTLEASETIAFSVKRDQKVDAGPDVVSGHDRQHPRSSKNLARAFKLLFKTTMFC